MLGKESKITLSKSSEIAQVILAAVAQLNLGSIKVAEFLRGSKAHEIKNLQSNQGYGGLYWLSIDKIRALIEQLLKQEYLIQEAISGNGPFLYPILKLTQKGKVALEQKSEIVLHVPIIEREISISDTHKKTLEMFRQGLKPEQIAEKRELAISTIMGHFCDLVAVGQLSAKQLVSDFTIRDIQNVKKSKSSFSSVKEIKEKLPDVPYEIIRIVVNDKNI